jgi:hypothetical protein
MRQPHLTQTRSGRATADAKVDATTRAVREIVALETAERVAKTERLKAARLAAEAARPVPAAEVPRRGARRIKAAS